MWIRTLVLAALLCTQTSARVHRGRPRKEKIFPANHGSVLLENQAADAIGAFKYTTQEQVDEAVYAGHLAALYNHNIYVVCPKLPVNRRYALPATVVFVEQLSLEFYDQFHAPLMVDSAIRPATTQKWLMHRNRNAAPAYGERASSHERGTTIDFSKRLTKAQYQWIVYRLLYYRAIERILVIEEKSCLHIFVKGIYGDTGNYGESTEVADGRLL